jgi:hypothetical protein
MEDKIHCIDKMKNINKFVVWKYANIYLKYVIIYHVTYMVIDTFFPGALSHQLNGVFDVIYFLALFFPLGFVMFCIGVAFDNSFNFMDGDAFYYLTIFLYYVTYKVSIKKYKEKTSFVDPLFPESEIINESMLQK